MYYSLLFAPFFSLIIFYLSSKRIDFLLSIFIFVFFTLFAGLRYCVDVDYGSYWNIYNSTPVFDSFNADTIRELQGEVGFLMVLSILKSVEIPFFMFVLFSSFFSLWGKIHFFKATVGYSALATSLYMCFYFINIEFITIRWALSTSFIILGYYYIFYKNSFLVFCFFILSVLFHYYSLLFILIAFLPLQKINIFNYFILFSITSIVSMFVKFAGFSIDFELGNSDIYLISKISRYLTNIQSNVGVISILKVLLFTLTFYYFYITQRNIFNDRLNCYLLRLTMVIFTICMALVNIPVFFQRGIVVGDILAIALMLRLLSQSNSHVGFKAVKLYGFTFVCMLWCAIDINSKLNVGTISQYKNWLQFLL